MPLSLPDLPTPVSLRRLFPSASFVGSGDVIASDVTEDSREVTSETIFAAIRGARFDGADFAQEAVLRGCAAILTDRPLASVAAPQCVVRNVRAAYSRVCNAVSGSPVSRLNIAGVTGTNGKTTTTWMLRSILEASDRACGLLGSIEYHDGATSVPAGLTTPDARSVFRSFRKFVENGCRHAAIELSSHALAQDRITGTRLSAAIVTNVTQDHFDYHAGREEYLAAKAKIFSYVGSGGVIAINADDPGSRGLLREAWASGRHVTTFGIDQKVDVHGEILEETTAGTRFLLTSEACGLKDGIEITLSLPGRHNVLNSLGAAAAALHLGVDVEDIRHGLEELSAVPGRLERIDGGQEFPVFVDYAHTEDALRRVLESLRPLTSGRLFCVFGAGGDRDRSKRPLLGRAAAHADVAVVTSDNPRSEPPEQIMQEIVEGIPNGFPGLHLEADRREAIAFALSEAGPDDCVLIAGKGHETKQIVGDSVVPFDDRDIARELLSRLVPVVGSLAAGITEKAS